MSPTTISRLLLWSEVATILLVVWLSVVPSSHGLYCDPVKNVYYVPQFGQCLNCERCLIGEEPIPIEEWDIEIRYRQGPTECRKCRTCKSGTYSKHRSFQCTKCTNCSAIGKVEQTACSHTTDTVCTNISTTQSTTSSTSTRQGGGLKRTVKEPKAQSPHDSDVKANTYLPVIAFLAVAIFLLLVAAAVYRARTAIVKRKRRHAVRYDELSTTDPSSCVCKCIQSREDIGTTGVKARSEIISEVSPAKLSSEKTGQHRSRLPWCEKKQAKKGTSSETLPLLKGNRSYLCRRRHNSYPSAGSYCSVSPLVSGDFVNEASTAENLDTDGSDSTSEGRESPVSSRPPVYTRQCSYPLGKSEKANKVVTDQLILAKVGEIVLRQDDEDQYDNYYENEAPGQRSSGSGDLQIDAAKGKVCELVENNIPSDLLSAVLSDENIRKFSTIIIKHDIYKDVARELGLTEDDLHEVQVDYDKVKERSLQAIYKVKQKKANICVKDVVNVLEQLHHMDIRDTFLAIMTAQSR